MTSRLVLAERFVRVCAAAAGVFLAAGIISGLTMLANQLRPGLFHPENIKTLRIVLLLLWLGLSYSLVRILYQLPHGRFRDALGIIGSVMVFGSVGGLVMAFTFRQANEWLVGTPLFAMGILYVLAAASLEPPKRILKRWWGRPDEQR